MTKLTHWRDRGRPSQREDKEVRITWKTWQDPCWHSQDPCIQWFRTPQPSGKRSLTRLGRDTTQPEDSASQPVETSWRARTVWPIVTDGQGPLLLWKENFAWEGLGNEGGAVSHPLVWTNRLSSQYMPSSFLAVDGPGRKQGGSRDDMRRKKSWEERSQHVVLSVPKKRGGGTPSTHPASSSRNHSPGRRPCSAQISAFFTVKELDWVRGRGVWRWVLRLKAVLLEASWGISHLLSQVSTLLTWCLHSGLARPRQKVPTLRGSARGTWFKNGKDPGWRCSTLEGRQWNPLSSWLPWWPSWSARIKHFPQLGDV